MCVEVESKEAFHEAITVAMCYIGWPIWIAFLGCLVVIQMSAGAVNLVGTALILFFGSLGIAYLAAVVAVPVGWFAHRWFWQSRIPVNRMAAVMALIMDGVIIGWIMAIVLNPSL